eukprot:3567598-Pleurochrysis_carterae.AAC.1
MDEVEFGMTPVVPEHMLARVESSQLRSKRSAPDILFLLISSSCSLGATWPIVPECKVMAMRIPL